LLRNDSIKVGLFIKNVGNALVGYAAAALCRGEVEANAKRT
jgi:hypothetical protein